MTTESVASAIAAVLPADRILRGTEYEERRRVWNGAVDRVPAVIVRPETVAEVARAVRAARRLDVPVSVRAGGHDWAGRAVRDNALVVDLGGMRDVEIDGEVARVGGGATADDVLTAAGAQGKSAALGTVGSVGVVGLVLGGGYGSLIGVTGLGIDNLISAQVVLADGAVTFTDREHEPDLFWALRGGGGNFGVVTNIELRLHPIPDVVAGTIAFSLTEAEHILRGLQQLHSQLDDALDVIFGAMHTPAGAVLFTSPVWADSADDGISQIDGVRALGTPVLDDVARRPLADVVRGLNDFYPAGNHYRIGSRIASRIDDAFIESFVACALNMPSTCALYVHHAHGAATRVAVDATAHAYRDPHLVVEILGMWSDGDGTAESEWVRTSENRFAAIALPGGWTNIMATDDPRAQDAYGPNRARLLAAKHRYDPDNVFNAIPLPSSAAGW